MEKIYSKLVRDNIPSIIENDNEIPITRILSDDEYRKELYKKLVEECNELISATTSDDIIEEASDVFEVLTAISELEGKNIDDVIRVSKQKKEKKVDLHKRYFWKKQFQITNSAFYII